jgi:hypothetical protein
MQRGHGGLFSKPKVRSSDAVYLLSEVPPVGGTRKRAVSMGSMGMRLKTARCQTQGGIESIVSSERDILRGVFGGKRKAGSYGPGLFA